jgi:hypothetical protein
MKIFIVFINFFSSMMKRKRSCLATMLRVKIDRKSVPGETCFPGYTGDDFYNCLGHCLLSHRQNEAGGVPAHMISGKAGQEDVSHVAR